MQEEETATTSSAEEPSKESRSAALEEIWIELNRNEEGVGLSLHRQYEDGEIVVEDEAWWTWSEFTGMTTSELNISRSGSTRMDAVHGSSILSPNNILSAVFNSPFTLVNLSEIKGEVGDKPVYDELTIPSEEDVLAEFKEAM